MCTNGIGYASGCPIKRITPILYNNFVNKMYTIGGFCKFYSKRRGCERERCPSCCVFGRSKGDADRIAEPARHAENHPLYIYARASGRPLRKKSRFLSLFASFCDVKKADFLHNGCKKRKKQEKTGKFIQIAQKPTEKLRKILHTILKKTNRPLAKEGKMLYNEKA